VLFEGAVIAILGIAVGVGAGFGLARFARSQFADMQMPDALPVIVSALVLLAAAVIASFLPAARASRVDVMTALRTE
jgi:putative ABC transport system permease protein